MNFHIVSSLAKSLRFSKSAILVAAISPFLLVSCKGESTRKKAPSETGKKVVVNPLEKEIEKMLLTKKDDPQKLTKLVKGKPWKELLESCMRVERSLDPKPSKNRIAWTRFSVRGAFFDAQLGDHKKEKEKNMRELKRLLREMAEEEGLAK